MLRIVTATRGTSPWLAECLTSMAGLRDQSAEHLVVTPEPQCTLLRPLCGNSRVVPQTGAGLYDALNVGFRAKGEWTFGTWINDDDLLVTEGLRKALALLRSDSAVGAVFGRVCMIDRAGRRFSEIPVAHRGRDLGPLIAGGIVPLAQPGTVFRRELFDQLNGFDCSFTAAGDLDFFRRALAAGFKFEYVDSVVADFRVHGAQISQRRELMKRETSRVCDDSARTGDWLRRATAAWWRFRCCNLPLYARRVLDHGVVSMDELSRRT